MKLSAQNQRIGLHKYKINWRCILNEYARISSCNECIRYVCGKAERHCLKYHVQYFV